MDRMVEVMELVKKYTPKFRGVGFSGEDVAQEFFVKFTQQGFLQRYDAKKSSLNRYVFLGMRNIAVDFLRKAHKVRSLDLVSDSDSSSYMDSLQYTVPLMDRVVEEEVVSFIPAMPFGYSKVFEFDGVSYHSTHRSIVALLMKGFTRSEIAVAFGVSNSTIDKAIAAIKPVLTKLYPGRR